MGKLKVGCMVLGSVQTNCYYVYGESGTEAMVIDPADRGDLIFEKLADEGLTVGGILLTHGHFDHVWGLEDLKRLSGAKVYACLEEKELLEDAEMNVSAQMGRSCSVKADVFVGEGDVISAGGLCCRVIFTPGHTGGSCCFYFEGDGVLFSGDTLFLESVGRTDFPTGSGGALGRSLREKLAVLPEDTLVYPGHGDVTTIGHEMMYNPFCR